MMVRVLGKIKKELFVVQNTTNENKQLQWE